MNQNINPFKYSQQEKCDNILDNGDHNITELKDVALCNKSIEDNMHEGNLVMFSKNKNANACDIFNMQSISKTPNSPESSQFNGLHVKDLPLTKSSLELLSNKDGFLEETNSTLDFYYPSRITKRPPSTSSSEFSYTAGGFVNKFFVTDEEREEYIAAKRKRRFEKESQKLKPSKQKKVDSDTFCPETYSPNSLVDNKCETYKAWAFQDTDKNNDLLKEEEKHRTERTSLFINSEELITSKNSKEKSYTKDISEASSVISSNTAPVSVTDLLCNIDLSSLLVHPTHEKKSPQSLSFPVSTASADLTAPTVHGTNLDGNHSSVMTPIAAIEVELPIVTIEESDKLNVNSNINFKNDKNNVATDVEVNLLTHSVCLSYPVCTSSVDTTNTATINLNPDFNCSNVMNSSAENLNFPVSSSVLDTIVPTNVNSSEKCSSHLKSASSNVESYVSVSSSSNNCNFKRNLEVANVSEDMVSNESLRISDSGEIKFISDDNPGAVIANQFTLANSEIEFVSNSLSEEIASKNSLNNQLSVIPSEIASGEILKANKEISLIINHLNDSADLSSINTSFISNKLRSLDEFETHNEINANSKSSVTNVISTSCSAEFSNSVSSAHVVETNYDSSFQSIDESESNSFNNAILKESADDECSKASHYPVTESKHSFDSDSKSSVIFNGGKSHHIEENKVCLDSDIKAVSPNVKQLNFSIVSDILNSNKVTASNSMSQVELPNLTLVNANSDKKLTIFENLTSHHTNFNNFEINNIHCSFSDSSSILEETNIIKPNETEAEKILSFSKEIRKLKCTDVASALNVSEVSNATMSKDIVSNSFLSDNKIDSLANDSNVSQNIPLFSETSSFKAEEEILSDDVKFIDNVSNKSISVNTNHKSLSISSLSPENSLAVSKQIKITKVTDDLQKANCRANLKPSGTTKNINTKSSCEYFDRKCSPSTSINFHSFFNSVDKELSGSLKKTDSDTSALNHNNDNHNSAVDEILSDLDNSQNVLSCCSNLSGVEKDEHFLSESSDIKLKSQESDSFNNLSSVSKPQKSRKSFPPVGKAKAKKSFPSSCIFTAADLISNTRNLPLINKKRKSTSSILSSDENSSQTSRKSCKILKKEESESFKQTSKHDMPDINVVHLNSNQTNRNNNEDLSMEGEIDMPDISAVHLNSNQTNRNNNENLSMEGEIDMPDSNMVHIHSNEMYSDNKNNLFMEGNSDMPDTNIVHPHCNQMDGDNKDELSMQYKLDMPDINMVLLHSNETSREGKDELSKEGTENVLAVTSERNQEGNIDIGNNPTEIVNDKLQMLCNLIFAEDTDFKIGEEPISVLENEAVVNPIDCNLDSNMTESVSQVNVSEVFLKNEASDRSLVNNEIKNTEFSKIPLLETLNASDIHSPQAAPNILNEYVTTSFDMVQNHKVSKDIQFDLELNNSCQSEQEIQIEDNINCDLSTNENSKNSFHEEENSTTSQDETATAATDSNLILPSEMESTPNLHAAKKTYLKPFTAAMKSISGQKLLNSSSSGKTALKTFANKHLNRRLYDASPSDIIKDGSAIYIMKNASANGSSCEEISDDDTKVPGEWSSQELIHSKSFCTCIKDDVPCLFDGESLQQTCEGEDTVDGNIVPCSRQIYTHSLLSPSQKVKFRIFCDIHLWRLKHHHCCPCCGIFCTQGKFLMCQCENVEKHNEEIHLFHTDCYLVPRAGLPPGCPHCCRFTNFDEVQLALKTLPEEISKIDPTVRNLTGHLKDYCISMKIVNVENEKPLETLKYNIPEKEELKSMLMAISDKCLHLRPTGKCLYNPIKVGDVKKVLQLLVNGVNPNHKFKTHKNNTPLHIAAYFGFIGIVHVLLQYGGVINAVNDDLETPLILAVERKHIAVVRYMIWAGADINAKTENGLTAFHASCKSGCKDIAQLLYDVGNFDINIQDDGGWTPLVWACEYKYLNTVLWLLELGADPNIRDSELNIASHWAACSGESEILNVLLDNGCSLSFVNRRGDTALHIAARKGHYSCVRLLLERGAPTDRKNEDGETPSMCCDVGTKSYRIIKKYQSLVSKKKRAPLEHVVFRDISLGLEKYAIQVVNEIDSEEFVLNFRYVVKNCQSSDISIVTTIDSMKWCPCKSNCGTGDCACAPKCWYDSNGCLVSDFNIADPPTIFECHKLCHCPISCLNRVAQKGLRTPLQVFRTLNQGWGVRSLKNLSKGAFVCEYVGELIRGDEVYDREDTYIFDLNSKNGDYCLDGRFYGNVARFFNHSCEPNLVALPVYMQHQDQNFPHIGLYALRDIPAFEELCFDYGPEFWITKCQTILCTCGFSSCKYSKDAIDDTLETIYCANKILHSYDTEVVEQTDAVTQSFFKPIETDDELKSRQFYTNNCPGSLSENREINAVELNVMSTENE